MPKKRRNQGITAVVRSNPRSSTKAERKAIRARAKKVGRKQVLREAWVKGKGESRARITAHVSTAKKGYALAKKARRVGQRLSMPLGEKLTKRIVRKVPGGDEAMDTLDALDHLEHDIGEELRKNPRSPTRGTRVQSLIFSKAYFTVRTAHQWALAHGFKATTADVQTNTIRVRQLSPASVTVVGTITLTRGVKATVARPHR